MSRVRNTIRDRSCLEQFAFVSDPENRRSDTIRNSLASHPIYVVNEKIHIVHRDIEKIPRDQFG